MRQRARRNLDLLEKYIQQKDLLYAELLNIAITNKKKKIKNKHTRVLTLKGEIEYIRRLICNPEYGLFPTSNDVPKSWQKVSKIEKFF